MDGIALLIVAAGMVGMGIALGEFQYRAIRRRRDALSKRLLRIREAKFLAEIEA